jgi:hypothetical protein
MSTTNLFVELLVTGFGALIWMSLTVISFFGWEWIPLSTVLSAEGIAPIFAITYLLGIVTDRVSDVLFEHFFTRSLREKHFPNSHDYHEARLTVITKSDRLAALHEYARSRLRICRGWTLNFCFIAISTNVFIWSQRQSLTSPLLLSVFITLFCVFLTVGCWFTWSRLTATEYIRLKDQCKFLRNEETRQIH